MLSTADLSNGIVISTQKPSEVETFPRRGGTAAILREVTSLPIIYIHKDGKATENEQKLLKRVKDQGTVFITGHGSATSDVILGGYEVDDGRQLELSVDLDFYVEKLTQYSDHDAIKHLTIVLWACKAGTGEADSTAAKLALKFKERNINTRIIASTNNMRRYDGRRTEYESTNNLLGFNTDSEDEDASAFRVFDTNEKAMSMSTVTEKFYFGANGEISNLKFDKTKPLIAFKAEEIVEEKEVENGYKKKFNPKDKLFEHIAITLNIYISNRESYTVKNKYIKQYQHMFFKSLQYSYTDKMTAIDSLREAFNDDKKTLTNREVAILKQGDLGRQLKTLVKKKYIKSHIKKMINSEKDLKEISIDDLLKYFQTSRAATMLKPAALRS